MLLAAAANTAADDAAAQVKRSARQLLEEQAMRAGFLDSVFNLTVVPPNRPLPVCRQPLRIDTIDTRQARRMRFAATCPGSDGWRHEFVVRASMSASVLVAAVALPAGHELTAADVALAQRDVTNVSDALASPQAVLGMTSRRSVRAGEVVREGWLVRSTLVHRGAAVSIVARS
ncbi:MAG TPA: flagellar basal body P-ring formation chaperone FlgA, partial [Burkholderiaceae bacterium]|nr:flagellar basal body P-ring formation chaperone FlgA [Burkholderiaceae bacterium]